MNAAECMTEEELCQSKRTILRTAKTSDQRYLMLDLETVLDNQLKGWQREIHLLLMSKGDRWNTDGMTAWLESELKGRCCRRTIQYAIAALRKKRYLRRTVRAERTRKGTIWRRGYQVFEVPPPASKGFDPDEATIVHTGKYCDGNRPPDFRERAFGTMPGGRHACDSPSKTVSGGCKNLRTRKGWDDSLSSKENQYHAGVVGDSFCGKTGKAATTPVSRLHAATLELEAVCSPATPPPRWHDAPPLPDTGSYRYTPIPDPVGGKRRKGRRAPAKAHNARKGKSKATSRSTYQRPVEQMLKRRVSKAKPQRLKKKSIPRVSKLTFNAASYRATADATEFMANLPTRMGPALADLRNLPHEAFTQPWIDALMANPLIAVAEDVLGYDTWSADDLRGFLRSLGSRYSLHDLVLCWIGFNSGYWDFSTHADMKRRLHRRFPKNPDVNVCPVSKTPVDIFRWHQALDIIRHRLSREAENALRHLLDGVNLEDPASIQEHPLLWTALLAVPEAYELATDEAIDLARRTLVPVSREEVVAWIDEQSYGMPCRWHARFCVGGAEGILARGLSRVAKEWLELPMLRPSPYAGHDGKYRAWTNRPYSEQYLGD